MEVQKLVLKKQKFDIWYLSNTTKIMIQGGQNKE